MHKRLDCVPIFLERWATKEAFLPDHWKCDDALKSWDEWRARTLVCDKAMVCRVIIPLPYEVSLILF